MNLHLKAGLITLAIIIGLTIVISLGPTVCFFAFVGIVVYGIVYGWLKDEF